MIISLRLLDGEVAPYDLPVEDVHRNENGIPDISQTATYEGPLVQVLRGSATPPAA